MARATPKMGLEIWDQTPDLYQGSQLAQDFAKIDTHDHSTGKGVQISTAGIAAGALVPTHFSAVPWTTYTPTWTAVSVNPAINNGTLTGRYLVMGKTCFVRIQMTAGSTTTFGTGVWSFTLPFTTRSSDTPQIISALSLAATTYYAGAALAVTNTNTVTPFGTGTTGYTSAVPATWTSGNFVIIEGVYETN
jgi:hypothetical protein